MATRTPRGFGQYSGVARAMELVGERWAMLIVRDLLGGARRYGDLKANLPRIPTNILSDRLKELQAAGLIRRVPAVRGGYELTPPGRELEPVVLALERWGWGVLGDPAEGENVTCDALAISLRAAFQPDAAAQEPPTCYLLHVADASVAAITAAGELQVVPMRPDATPAAHETAEFSLTPAGFHQLLAGGDADARIIYGDRCALERFRRSFGVGVASGAPCFSQTLWKN